MKAIKYLGFAAAVILMTACSNNNDELGLPEQPKMISFHATIDGPGSATRTTYTTGKNAQDKDIVNVAWKAGDEIALIHGGKLEKLTVTTVHGDGSATVSGTITKPSGSSEAAKLVYPYSAVGGALDGANFDYSYLVENRLNSQNGVLNDIATNGLDIREGTATIVVNGNQGEFSGNVSMPSKIILWKFTLKNSGGTANINATQLKIEVAHDSYTSILAKAVKGSASSEFVMAVPDKIVSLLSNASNTLKITALGSDGFNYSYTRTKATTLASGKYYESALKMAKAVGTNPAYYAATGSDVGKVIGANGTIYDDETAAANASTTAVAKMVYVGTASTAFRGLAIALSNDASNYWGTVVTAAAAKADAPEGSTWFLPTVLDWQCMSTTIKSVLGASEYWTGTEISDGKAYYCRPSTAVYGIAEKSNAWNSRACLAF